MRTAAAELYHRSLVISRAASSTDLAETLPLAATGPAICLAVAIVTFFAILDVAHYCF